MSLSKNLLCDMSKLYAGNKAFSKLMIPELVTFVSH